MRSCGCGKLAGTVQQVCCRVLALVLPALLVACSHSPVHSRVHSMRWESGWRTYRLHTPPNHDKSKPVPLVVMLHGIFINASLMEAMSRFSDLSDKEGFVVVYPNARKSRLRSFYPGLPMRGVENALGPAVRADEIGFVNAVVDEVSRDHAIDPNRIYLAGLSNGGLLATHIMSEDLGKRYRGVALIAMSAPSLHLEALEEKLNATHGFPTPVPLILFHGDDDPLFKIKGGIPLGLPDEWRVDGALNTAMRWDKLAGGDGVEDACTPMPEGKREDRTHTLLHEFRNAKGQPTVRYYEVQGGGHSWPGPKNFFSPAEKLLGGKATDFSATEEIWRFFSQSEGTK